MWFTLPFLIILVGTLALTNLPGWLFFISLIGGFLLLRFMLRKYWPGKETKNPHWIGWFYSTFLLSTLHYFSFILPASVSNIFSHVVFIVLSFSLLGIHIWLATGNPGRISRDRKQEDDVRLAF